MRELCLALLLFGYYFLRCLLEHHGNAVARASRSCEERKSVLLGERLPFLRDRGMAFNLIAPFWGPLFNILYFNAKKVKIVALETKSSAFETKTSGGHF